MWIIYLNSNRLFKNIFCFFRILLPWKGLQDAELEAESGIQGAYFVDPSGSIGGAKTIEAAMEMAEQTLKLNGFYF